MASLPDLLSHLFDNNHMTRSRFYDPFHVARAAGIRAGHTVVDLLAGHAGHIAFPAAGLAGSSGKIYAVDLRPGAIESIRGRCQLGYKGCIEPIHAHMERVGGVPLENGIADTVLLVDALSLLQNRLDVVREAVRLLKSRGVLAVVDWHPYGEATHGPVMALRLTEQEARSLCLVNDVAYEGAFDAGEFHYGFTCRRV